MKQNTRHKQTQLKRKRLDLSPDGKCCEFRTRKASLAFRLAEQSYEQGRRQHRPCTGDFEFVSKKQRIREERRALKWMPIVAPGLVLSPAEAAFLKGLEKNVEDILRYVHWEDVKQP